MNKEFVMRGQTVSGSTEVLNFTGDKPGYAYRLVEFELLGSTNLGGAGFECFGSITAGNTAVTPTDPDFNNEGLIGTAFFTLFQGSPFNGLSDSIVNDTFLITQDLILMVQNTDGGTPVNWQCRFVGEKINTNEQAVANYKQFTIRDE